MVLDSTPLVHVTGIIPQTVSSTLYGFSIYKIAKGEKKSRTLVIFSIFVRKLHSEVGEQDYVLHCVRLRAGHLDTRLYTQYNQHLVTTM